jgi:hypothetical protein
VLFIGTSYTYTNNMPSILRDLAESSDSSLRISAESVTIPGATLEQLWEDGDARRAIKNGKWNYVVLQEFSDRPITDTERMYKYARLFDTEVKASGATTVLFLTWSNEDEPGNQPLLDHAYFALAKELNALVAPVGPAWRVARELDQAILLYADGRHPRKTGSYLAACVFYLVMNADSQTCPPLDSWFVSQKDVDIVQRAASQAMRGLR